MCELQSLQPKKDAYVELYFSWRTTIWIRSEIAKDKWNNSIIHILSKSKDILKHTLIVTHLGLTKVYQITLEKCICILQ